VRTITPAFRANTLKESESFAGAPRSWKANPLRNFLRAYKAAIPARVPVTVNAASAVEVGMGSRVRDFVHLLSASGPRPASGGGYS
jgi:hypothetical protein